MKAKICFWILFIVLFCCGCAEENESTSLSENVDRGLCHAQTCSLDSRREGID